MANACLPLCFCEVYISHDAKRCDEVKELQMGQKKHGSASAPSVPLMITWLHCDVTRLDGEALQKNSFSLTLMKWLLERDLLQTQQN